MSHSTLELSIGELAEAAGLSRRAVRFYVQRGLLPPPRGKGRGSAYTGDHLARLRRILDLQTAGHSLEAIRQILAHPDAAVIGARAAARVPADSHAAPAEQDARRNVPPASATSRRNPQPTLTARLWSHLTLAPGVELHVDMARHRPSAEQILAVREAVRQILQITPPARSDKEDQP